MQSVTQIAQDILSREGGYVNDPDDPGGATNHGVTVHTLRRLGIDLNNDGAVDARDVQLLSMERACTIFIDHYFHGPGLDQLPEPLQVTVFDMYVNAGNNAVKILQRLLNQMWIDVAVDGALGPQTTAAAQKKKSLHPTISSMPMELHGAITITRLPMVAAPAANTQSAVMVAKVAGSHAPKISSPQVSFDPRTA
jgi:lysozyme family protein